MVGGFTAGVALGQQIGQQLFGGKRGGRMRSSMTGGSNIQYNSMQRSTNQRLQSAKLAAYKRMKSRQMTYDQSSQFNNRPFENTFSNKNNQSTPIDQVINYALPNDPSGQLLKSIRSTIMELNDFVKRATNGVLDLNISMAIFFIVRGIRKFIMEKQYPNAWQLIWWASSILRGWRLM